LPPEGLPRKSMPMKRILFGSLFALVACLAANAADEEGFVSLMDGKSFKGWKMSEENQDTWKIQDGAFVANGNRCHLFYEGDGKPFKNFHFKAQVKTEPNSNGGIYFHTKYQASDWPRIGFETQVNNTHKDWRKTGSLYGLADVGYAAAQDGKWWTHEIIVQGNKATVMVDGKVVIEYNEPAGAQPGKPFERKINEGTFALQGHDPGSTVCYKDIRVKRLD
jgi:hypothetical protein